MIRNNIGFISGFKLNRGFFPFFQKITENQTQLFRYIFSSDWYHPRNE